MGHYKPLKHKSVFLKGVFKNVIFAFPVNPAIDRASKIFASCYALYSGVAFLTSVAVIFAPVLHRFLHRFHMDTEA
jgi:hypothetical protein